ncbi:hypothetical protein G7Y79_00003g008780 [Physcia stellaris]|nr:hypothetical protein G7Y79_00003g008780 [Physcia stellaris]
MHFPLLLSAITTLPFTLSAPTASTNNCPSTIIRNGGFESGVTPPTSGGTDWTVVGFLGSSTYQLTQPGSTKNGGKYAFTAILYPGPYSPESGDTLTQTLSTCTGKNYSITADYKFDTQANGACSISIQYPYKTTRGSVTTGSAISPAGVWYTTGATFQAVSSSDRLDIVFSCGDRANNRISVDNVKVAPFNGNAF